MAKWQLLAVLAGVLVIGTNGLLATRRAGNEQLSKLKGLDSVISLLKTMLTDFVDQSRSDQEAWESYQKLSEESERDRTEYSRNQASLSMANEATLNAKKQEVAQLGEELNQLESDIGVTHKSMSELVKMREEEHKQHVLQMQELRKTTDSVSKAVDILEGQYAASGASLTEIKQDVELAVTLTSVGQKSALSSLMQDPNWLDVDGAAAHGSYQTQSGGGGVVGTLKNLRSTLDTNRQESVEKESQGVRDFESARDANQAQLGRLAGQTKQKTTQKQEAEAAITQATATIDMANKNKADADAYLQTLSSDVATFQAEYQKRTNTRSDEQSATQQAYDVLQSVSVGAKGSAGASLMQKAPNKMCNSCEKEAKKLSSISQNLGGSTALTQVAGELKQRSSASFDPNSMEPVKQLLSKLINRLETEQSAETSHHDWCETEKTSSQSAKEQKVSNVEALRGVIERLTTSVQQLGGELGFLNGEISRVGQETREATQNRNDARKAFSSAKRDHDEVISAVEAAAKALGDQYSLVQGKKAASTGGKVLIKHYSLVQGTIAASQLKGSPFDAYKSGSGSAGSVSEMLADLLKRYSDARDGLVNDEKVAVAAFNELEATNNQFVADAQNESNAKMAERRGKLSQLKDAKEEMTSNFLELQELSQYLQDLRPSCDDIRTTFEERKKRREAEIAALQECMNVLEDPSGFQ